jgi:hypothetical protein
MIQSLKTTVFMGIGISVIATVFAIRENIFDGASGEMEEIVSPRNLSPVLNESHYKLSAFTPYSDGQQKGKLRGNLSCILSRKPTLLNIEVERGDKIIKLLATGEIESSQAASLVSSHKGIYDFKKLKVGQNIKLSILENPDFHEAAVHKIIGLSL